MASTVDDSSSARDARYATGANGAANPALEHGASEASESMDREKVLPLPAWLVRFFYLFAVVLYIPDAIFNYYVYSDGATPPQGNPLVSALTYSLWGFLAIGIVGMAYFCAILAPYHWSHGNKLRSFFCWLGLLVATAVTMWNSLAFRSRTFHEFPTDKLLNDTFPQLAQLNLSPTMFIVSLMPPFWGLFWALVQPAQTSRNLRQLQESHAERLMRMQQDAELKRLRAETNAKIREAQLRGMAQTMGAARQQASGLFSQMRNKDGKDGAAQPGALGAEATPDTEGAQAAASSVEDEQAAGILQLPLDHPVRSRALAGGRASFMNNVAPATPATHAQPANGARPLAAQAQLLSDADVRGSAGVPASDTTWGPRRPPTLGDVLPGEMSDADAMTGTSGLRHAMRRPNELSGLTRNMGVPKREHIQAVDESYQELNPTGKKRVTQKDWETRIAAKLNVDELTARRILSAVREYRKTAQKS